MVRASVSLLGCLMLTVMVTGGVIAHPGDNYLVTPFVDLRWEPDPTGAGNGDVVIETWVKMRFGVHISGDPHPDNNHTAESYHHHGIFTLGGSPKVMNYYVLEADRGRTPDRNIITFIPPETRRSAEQCFDVYGHAYGVFRYGPYGNATYYNETRTWLRERDYLPPQHCGGLRVANPGDTPAGLDWSHEDAYSELRNVFDQERRLDADIVGAANLNGQIHVLRFSGSTVETSAIGTVSAVTGGLSPAAPPIRKRKISIATTWGTLKQR